MSFYYYTPSTPRPVKGGIRSQSGRGREKSWWAERWMAVLDGFGMGARLDRGRSYARRGQVVSVDVGRGAVTAKVQGSRRQPYLVSIGVRQLSPSEWERLAAELVGRPAMAAELLAGRMPKNIEELFASAGLSLFPGRSGDMNTVCNCPDWANPCKHIAAVYILLGEEFDRDPFVIFKMRGSGRDGILEMAGLHLEPEGEKAMPAEPPQPLPADPAEFWGGAGSGAPEAAGTAEVPAMAAALPKRLGGFPFWRGGEDFMSAMEGAYQAASPAGMGAFLGEDSDEDPAREDSGRDKKNL
ncbi:MAG: SWIM zinc finger family protein [Nitrosopumilaceae archaeon]|nr:SWIM zinc finger family protein [Nitrosopumilaceae archaeon]